MKTSKIFLTALLVMIGNMLIAQDTPNWRTLKLKGKVKAIKSIQYKKMKNYTDTLNYKDVITLLQEFNEKGKLFRITQNVTNGEFKRSCKFDTKGRVIEIVGEKKETFIKPYETDSLKTVKSTMKEVTAFVDIQRKSVSKMYENGEMSFQKVKKYDSRQLCVEVIIHETDKKKRSRVIYKYDVKGNKILENRLNFFTKVSVTMRYKYDSKGNNIEKEIIIPSAKSKTVMKYNKYNDIVEEVASVEGKDYKTTYSYTYDRYFNFLTKSQNNSDGTKKFTKRELTYFE